MAEKQCSSSGCTKESCEGCPSKNKPTSFQVASNEYTKVKHVIGVVSGKGGVGKSMVTASLANLMAENDIKVMSINLLMPDEEAPVIWRGPVISGMVKQFWTDVIWGELDYLFVDMPPGTGDVPLTVFQSLPLDGIVIVSSPQDLVQMIVKKAYHMAKSMNVPILGIVENYSYLVCPDCGKKISVFGESHIEEIAGKMDLKVLGKMPIDPSLAELSDKGDFAKAENKYLTDAFEVLHQLDRVKKEEE